MDFYVKCYPNALCKPVPFSLFCNENLLFSGRNVLVTNWMVFVYTLCCFELRFVVQVEKHMSWLHTLWFSYRTLSRTEPCPAAWWNLWWDTFTTTLGRCIATTWNCWKHSCRSGRTEWKYLTSKLRINTEHILLPFLFFSVYQNFEFFIHTCSIIVNLKCVAGMKKSLEFVATLCFFFRTQHCV